MTATTTKEQRATEAVFRALLSGMDAPGYSRGASAMVALLRGYLAFAERQYEDPQARWDDVKALLDTMARIERLYPC
jgi:hypothetical protein